MKGNSRGIVFCAMAVLLCLWISPTASATETEYEVAVPDEFAGILEQLPQELRESLPDGIFSKDENDFSAGVGEMSNPAFLLSAVLEMLGVKIRESAGALCVCIGLVLLAAVLSQLSHLAGERAELRFCNRLCILCAVLSGSFGVLSGVIDYFSQLTAMITASIPAMGMLYAVGGNVGAAAANSATLTAALSVCGAFCGKSVVPVFGTCFALSMMTMIVPGIDLSGFVNLIKKTWMTVFGFLSLLLTAALSMQTLLAAKSDSLGMKSAKYVAGNLIPVLGGTVAGTLGTLGASVELIRSSVGICGMLLLLLLLLPSLLHILVLRLVYMRAGALARTLGCGDEAGLFGELTSLYGYLAGTACVCTVVFFISFALLCGCGTAY